MRFSVAVLLLCVLSSCRDCYCELEQNDHFWSTRWAGMTEVTFIDSTGNSLLYEITNVVDSEREVYPHLSLCEGTDALGEISLDQYVALKWRSADNPKHSFGIDIDCNRIVFGWNASYIGYYTDWTNPNIMAYNYINRASDHNSPIISSVQQIGNYVRNDKDYHRCIVWLGHNIETGDTLYEFVISRDLGPIYIQPPGEEGMLRIFD